MTTIGEDWIVSNRRSRHADFEFDRWDRCTVRGAPEVSGRKAGQEGPAATRPEEKPERVGPGKEGRWKVINVQRSPILSVSNYRTGRRSCLSGFPERRKTWPNTIQDSAEKGARSSKRRKMARSAANLFNLLPVEFISHIIYREGSQENLESPPKEIPILSPLSVLAYN